MTQQQASGSFDVKIEPQSTPDKADGSTLGQAALAKTFRGDLDATSRGTMLTAVTDTQGSAGYVAIERVVGALAGRRGSFVLQHSGLMNRGAAELHLVVVPDSGTGDLAGLAGRMAIDIVDGRHFYRFEYILPAAH
ncbi:MAG TPA: DUF3224 domain-containing protein [Albitalea sp.]|uniref:DUF3224 domain-containing protein n=1 Tax=Piscinibacter sp. TaxID=1903157 RepID=UPI002ED0EE75